MANSERAVLAGGCFWGMQDLIRRLPGVLSTRVGYTGGDVSHATYRNHGRHAEGIEFLFDPEQLSYRRLLEYFFQIHNPTTRDRQGNDTGWSYRSAIYHVDERQRQIALDTIADVNASGLWPGKVVTEVESLNFQNEAGQFAVWCVTDNLPLSGLTDQCKDKVKAAPLFRAVCKAQHIPIPRVYANAKVSQRVNFNYTLSDTAMVKIILYESD